MGNKWDNLVPAPRPKPEKTAEQWAAEADGSKEEIAPAFKREKPSHAFHLRVNGYELASLQAFAAEDDTSLQRLVRKIVREYIDKRTSGGARKVPK